jgi:lipid-A-disaccharide synthase
MSSSHLIELPRPSKGHVDLLVIAAEHSGDEHAARMVSEVRRRRPELVIAALGGKRLEASGAQLLRDLTASSAMGFAVIAKISYYRALIAEIVRWVGEYRPRAVCFVDSSGLNLRIARGLFERGIAAKAGGPTRALYYISPQVWASRAGRRFKMAEHLDGLASIFPFEIKVYSDTSLPVDFVGHPFVASDYVAPVSYDPAGPVLLLPGSRRGPVARIFPVLVEAFRRAGGNREGVVLYPSEEIAAVLRATPVPAQVRFVPVGATVKAAAVLTTSGTMSMHCALAGIPGAVTYRADPLTYALGRMLVKVRYIGIANLLLGEEMYPEYVQGAATSEALAAELRASLEDPARRERTAEQAAKLRALLSLSTSGSAAEWLLRRGGFE